jgi:hypothetical protein
MFLRCFAFETEVSTDNYVILNERSELRVSFFKCVGNPQLLTPSFSDVGAIHELPLYKCALLFRKGVVNVLQCRNVVLLSLSPKVGERGFDHTK